VHVGLVSEDVEAGTGNRAVRERLHECRLIDDRASGDVDQLASRSECSEHLAGNQTRRLRPACTATNRMSHPEARPFTDET